MSISITITADSTEELGDKLLALGNRLVGNVFTNAVAVATATAKPATKPAKTPAKAEPAPEPAAEPEVAVEPEPEAVAQSADPVAEPAADLDFDTDVAPWVIRAVTEKGKPAVVDVMAEFGVSKASEMDAARWPELVARLAELLGE